MMLADLPTSDELLQAALDLARQGWKVFPCHTPINGICDCSAGPDCTDTGKHPWTRNGLTDATTDELKIRRWWKERPIANLATAVPEGYIVVDVDGEHGLARLQAEGKHVGTTAAQMTGRGTHYVYRTRERIHSRNLIPPSQKGAHDGVDLKGPGGYIMAAPSLHASGKVYEWGVPLSQVEIAPPWLEEVGRQSGGTTVGERQPVDFGAVLAGLPEGSRKWELYRAACKLRAADVPIDMAVMLAQQAAARCQPPLEATEAERKVLEAYGKYPPSGVTLPTHDSVTDYLRQGDLLYRQIPIAEKVLLTFRAGDIHRERTGTHARLEVIANQVTVAWGVINTDKDEDRVRLANSAGKQLNAGQGELYPNALLKKDLDDFCRGLWEAEVARFEPTYDIGLEPAPPDFILEPFIIRGGGTICFAPPGRGKSWTTMLMAVSIDAGISTIWPVTTAKVLILNLERSAPQYMRRIGAINRALSLPRERPIAILHARGRSLRDVIEGARRFIRRERIEVVILDSISRSGMGELNEGGVGTRIMDALNGLAESWLAIGHTPRASGEHVTGTMQFDAAADLMVKLSSEQEEDGPLGVSLELTKKNDIPYYKPRILALEFNREVGFLGYREARRGEFPTLEAGRKVSALQQLKDWTLDQVNGLGDATTAAQETGLNRATIAVLYSNREHFVAKGKDGKRALYGVRAL